ncbi:MAG TPA: hypothetical protein VKU02_04960 [Gemmataceae bacterium]|nr:hypothetical protein [Gemmataceae bacterium]
MRGTILSYSEFLRVCREYRILHIEEEPFREGKRRLLERVAARSPDLSVKIERLTDQEMATLFEYIQRHFGRPSQ